MQTEYDHLRIACGELREKLKQAAARIHLLEKEIDDDNVLLSYKNDLLYRYKELYGELPEIGIDQASGTDMMVDAGNGTWHGIE